MPNGASRHARWVRVAHWVLALAVLVLALSGFEILMVHPRLYWGNAGNDLTPALVELPISRNYKHGGWTKTTPFSGGAPGPVTASRTYDIFNQNGWGRSLHFLAAWFLVLPGAAYLVRGLLGGHFRANFSPTSGGSRYGFFQRSAYAFVVFVAAPLMVVTGLTMAPAVTAGFPFLLRLFGGYQSARTIHFVAFAALVAFTLGHVTMVVKTGFRRHMRSMTVGD